ncbi:MAG: 5-formyltetrahydrofolate cyclo-ligase, partial [Flavobacteriaceae bacterium]
MLKKELRSKYSQIRLSISPQDHQEKSIKIANALLGLPIWEKDVFHLFLPIEEKGEIETSHIL